MLTVENYTREELLAIDNFGEKVKFTGIVIVPTDEIHDSGYRCMKFILTDHMEIVGAVSGWSDVIHLNGIGGYGKEIFRMDGLAKRIDWRIDCLAKSGCIRLFTKVQLVTEDFIGSDFIIYAE